MCALYFHIACVPVGCCWVSSAASQLGIFVHNETTNLNAELKEIICILFGEDSSSEDSVTGMCCTSHSHSAAVCVILHVGSTSQVSSLTWWMFLFELKITIVPAAV